MTGPQFEVGDRCFTHYDMKWGTIERVRETRRGDKHGVTGNSLPDTTWYTVRYDDGGSAMLDDAHGDWDMARIVPPQIAQRFGYGADPKGGGMITRWEIVICAHCGVHRLPPHDRTCKGCGVTSDTRVVAVVPATDEPKEAA